jgi:outer membrane protein OmpA-like peptidoglycan-associated protein
MQDNGLDKYRSGNPFSLSIGDLMAGLLLIFILLLAATMLKVKNQEQKRKEITENYESIKDSLYISLLNEFKSDTLQWSARIYRQTLSIRFTEPDILFETGKSEIKPKFKEILDSFFFRYVLILNDNKYRSHIEEIRIEGHSSTEWNENIHINSEKAYFNNMKLSQDRTREVLEYCLNLLDIPSQRDWVKEKMTANGLSSSKIIYKKGTNEEDKQASRRVEFRVVTDAEKIIQDLVKASKEE